MSCFISAHDWDTFINFTRSTGARFLYDFNLQLRYGEQWDPTNAIATLEYLVSKGYGENIDFELGNGESVESCDHSSSCPWFPQKMINVS